MVRKGVLLAGGRSIEVELAGEWEVVDSLVNDVIEWSMSSLLVV